MFCAKARDLRNGFVRLAHRLVMDVVVACIGLFGFTSVAGASQGSLPADSGPKINYCGSRIWSGSFLFGTYRQIAGSWKVPPVTASNTTEFATEWIGLDGASNPDLIQTGVTEHTVRGITAYYAWYEILPAVPVDIPDPVGPGNRMSASIAKQTSGLWKIDVTDETSGWTWSKTFAYTGPGSSAEWIVETPLILYETTHSPLPDFSSFTFSAMKANRETPAMVTQMLMLGTSGRGVSAYPTPYEHGSFTDVYGSPTPVVRSVSPASGPDQGGSRVRISGSNFFGYLVTSVSFGSAKATIDSVSTNSVVVTVPRSISARTVTATVTSIGGSSKPSPAARYRYSGAIERRVAGDGAGKRPGTRKQ